MHADIIPGPRPITRKKDPKEVEKRLKQLRNQRGHYKSLNK